VVRLVKVVTTAGGRLVAVFVATEEGMIGEAVRFAPILGKSRKVGRGREIVGILN
jgi:hypothetical protein